MSLLFLLAVPLVAALATIFVRRQQRVIEAVAVGAAVIELVAGLVAVSGVARRGALSVGGSLALDAFSALIVFSVILVNFFALLYSVGFMRAEIAKGVIGFRRVRQYYALVHVFMLVVFLALSTTSPLMTWIAIEGTSLSAAFLISFFNKPSAMEAAWKQLIMNSVGLLLAFLGTIIFLAAAQHGQHLTGFISWAQLGRAALDPQIIKIAFVFIMIGYGTKVGWVPMHTWKPDAYSKAPTPVAVLMSSSLLNASLYAILRFKIAA